MASSVGVIAALALTKEGSPLSVDRTDRHAVVGKTVGKTVGDVE